MACMRTIRSRAPPFFTGCGPAYPSGLGSNSVVPRPGGEGQPIANSGSEFRRNFCPRTPRRRACCDRALAAIARNPVQELRPPAVSVSPSSSNAFSSSCACNGAASEPPNPFGHVALAITGEGVWSYGTMHPLGSSVIAYIKEQETKRNQRIYRIPATPEHDAAALNYLKSLPPGEMEGVRTDNCSTLKAGFDYPPLFPPGWFWSHFFDLPITTFAPQ
jgi:hypothetical protein